MLIRVSRLKGVQNIQFVFSFFIGWFLLGNLWTMKMHHSVKTSDLSKRSYLLCDCPRIDCSPCEPVSKDESEVNRKNIELAEGYFRTYRYKPLSADEDEVNRWRVLTKKFHYEMINQEPRIGINGMWKMEVNDLDKKAMTFLNQYDTDHGSKPRQWELEEIFRHYDPYYGIEYIANYVEKGKNERRSVEIRRPFVSGKPRLVSIHHESGNEMINIITPISQVTERFNKFLGRYEQYVLANPLSGPVRLLFVVFRPDDGQSMFKDDSVSHAVTVLDEFKQRNPQANVDYIFVKGEFSRAVGIHSGVLHCENDEIVLFLDIDLKMGSEFLGRVRRNTVRGERVVFPIMFSQYDPLVMDKAASIDVGLRSLVDDKMAINKQTGFWIHYAFGVAAMYKSDYLKVGGFRLDIKGWGGEDVDLFKKMVSDKDLDVMSVVDPDLIHIYHSRGCDVKLASDQYAMCVGAWSETLGSRLQVATLYLEHHKNDFNKL